MVSCFYCHAAHMQCLYTTARCVSVCLSTRQYYVKTAEWIKLVFSAEATLGFSYLVSYVNSDVSKNKGTSLWNLVANAELSWLSGVTSQHIDHWDGCCRVSCGLSVIAETRFKTNRFRACHHCSYRTFWIVICDGLGFVSLGPLNCA